MPLMGNERQLDWQSVVISWGDHHKLLATVTNTCYYVATVTRGTYRMFYGETEFTCRVREGDHAHVCTCVHKWACFFMCLFLCCFVCFLVGFFVCFVVRFVVCFFVCFFVCLFVCLFIGLFVCVLVCQLVC